MPKIPTPALKTMDAQKLKRRFLKIARKIGKRKRLTNAACFDLVFNTR